MKIRLSLLIFSVIMLFLSPNLVMAQSNGERGGHTAREEAEGKDIWEKIQAKQMECKSLTEEQYGFLGEYFMGQSIGNTERHAAMNQMMTSMMGEEGEKQIHIVMGKRLSSCDNSAQIPSSGIGFMPMMWMMAPLRQGFAGQGGGGNPMMGGWSGFGIFGWLSMILFWALFILGVIAIIRYLARSGQDKRGKTPLDILKERYAKGEIERQEFEEKKKDLS